MIYLIECGNILQRKDVQVFNEEFEPIGEIKYKKNKSEYNISSVDLETMKKYFVKTNPLKLKPKHIVFNEGKEQIAKISLGVKIIHSIIEADKYYFVKSAFWKIKYQAYDNRKVVASLELIRENGKRFYKINTIQKDYLTALSLFLLAQAVRRKALLK